VTGETTHCIVVYDRDRIYSPALDGALHAMGRRVLKTPVAAPQAKAYALHTAPHKMEVSEIRADASNV
jgi:hypothetical protein